MFEGMSAFHLSVPCLIFGQDRRALGLPKFDFKIVAAEAGEMRTDVGFLIPCEKDLPAVETADIVIIPSWGDIAAPPTKELGNALRAAHANGAGVAGLCLGAFPLAATGLLDGKRATTHWAYADELARLHPTVGVDAKVLYVDEGRLFTSAGVAAGLDCCLHIVRELYGSKVATLLARHIVMSPHRLGGQAQLIDMPMPPPDRNDRFAAVLDQVRATLDMPHSLDSAAEAANMTRRTFTRRFQSAHAMSFGEWLARERTSLARQLLETTELGIEDVALKAGFGTSTTLRTHFSQQFNISPTLYRRGFSELKADRS
jgi:transcriptional regulator GlxA family with amidase domain